jgi:hypothetical protein
MGGEPEIVVAAESDVVAAVHRDPRALRRFQQAPVAFQPPRLKFPEFRRKRLLE